MGSWCEQLFSVQLCLDLFFFIREAFMEGSGHLFPLYFVRLKSNFLTHRGPRIGHGLGGHFELLRRL